MKREKQDIRRKEKLNKKNSEEIQSFFYVLLFDDLRYFLGIVTQRVSQ